MTIIPFRWARELELTDLSDGEAFVAPAAFHPNMDVVEEAKGYRVNIELPGLAENDVELSFEKNVLHVKGEKKSEQQDKGHNFTRIERTYGSFYRTIPFAVEVDDSKIEAQFDKGILKIYLPKTAAALKEATKIKIKSA